MKGAAESPNYQTSNVRERYIEVVVVVGGGGGYKKRNIGRGRRSLSSSGKI